MSVEQTHVERETLSVEVNLPGHAPRTETSLFERTRKALIERASARFLFFATRLTATSSQTWKSCITSPDPLTFPTSRLRAVSFCPEIDP